MASCAKGIVTYDGQSLFSLGNDHRCVEPLPPWLHDWMPRRTLSHGPFVHANPPISGYPTPKSLLQLALQDNETFHAVFMRLHMHSIPPGWAAPPKSCGWLHQDHKGRGPLRPCHDALWAAHCARTQTQHQPEGCSTTGQLMARTSITKVTEVRRDTSDRARTRTQRPT